MKIYIIIPYFGDRFPNYFDLYLDSCSYNIDILEILILTNINTETYTIPNNVKIINTTLDEIRVRFSLLLLENFNLHISSEKLILQPYKLCDLKMLYGDLFSNELKNMGATENDYVGYGDIDLLYGKIENFIKLKSKKYGLLGRHGHFCVWKNIDEFNKFWTKVKTNYEPWTINKIKEEEDFTVIDFLLREKNQGLAEQYFPPQLRKYAEENGYEFFYICRIFSDVCPESLEKGYTGFGELVKQYKYFIFNSNPSNNKYLTCVYENGEEREKIYMHIQKRKMIKNFDSHNELFYAQRFSFDLEL